MFLIVLDILYYTFVSIYILNDLICLIRNKKYQKLWNEKKAGIIQINLLITKAQLCEIYVDFCKENKCKVDF